MTEAGTCPSCGAPLEDDGSTCHSCDGPLTGTREVVREPLRQEAALAYSLLQSAGFHPILAYVDEGDAPHPIDPEEPFNESVGLMVPLHTVFCVFVPEQEAEESLRVLEDARQGSLEGDDTGPS